MAQLDTVMRHLRRSVDQDACRDAQLLTAFVEHQDEDAFAALVKRHGHLVWGVCRRLLNHHDAEDAFQAAILILARKAESIRPREMLGGWLHGVAYRTALKARASRLKQLMREQRVPGMPEPAAAPREYSDLHAVLDQELTGLPERYRLPIILCVLGDKSIKEAARQLGWPPGTLAGRLFRGRKLLATRLARRGIVASAGSLVLPQVASAMPASLVGSTIEAATAKLAIPTKVAALMRGVMTAMLVTKLKAAALVLLVLTVVGVGGGFLSRSTTATAQPAGEQEKAHAKTQPTAYREFFAKTLGVIAEHFEQISYANLYEGRIEACTVQPDVNGMVRQADVRLTNATGGFAVDIRVNMKRTGEQTEIAGRDAALEREILAKLPQKHNHAPNWPVLPPKGQWRVASVTGGERAFDVYTNTDLVFLDERLLVVPNDPNAGPATVYRVHLGAKRPVQEIDIYQGGTRILGVYDIRQDELWLCLSNRRGTRPTNIEPSKTQTLLVARRIDTVEHKVPGPPSTTVVTHRPFPVGFVDGGTVKNQPTICVVTEIMEGDRIRFTVPQFAFQAGDLLDVVRRTPQPQYVGQIKVVQIDGTTATAAAITLKREIRQGDLVGHRGLTKDELALNVPLFFTIAASGKKNLWLRVDDRHWVERRPDGTESKYQIIARTMVRGRRGILISQMPRDAMQMFIPDKGPDGEALIRRLDQSDASWQSLGVMKNVE